MRKFAILGALALIILILLLFRVKPQDVFYQVTRCITCH